MLEKMLICALFIDATMLMGGNNGALGYLGHVQRSTAVQFRYSTETSANGFTLTEAAICH
jgi:hypothetical protein